MFLIIDDDPSIATMLGWYLDTYAHRNGYSIRAALSLEDGIKLAPQATIIILDYIFPDTDKKLVLESIAQLSAHAPVILMTGYEDSNGGNDGLMETAITEYGAAFVVFKSMLDSKSIRWLVLVIQALICHRMRRLKETSNEVTSPDVTTQE